MNWFLYDNGLRHKRVKDFMIKFFRFSKTKRKRHCFNSTFNCIFIVPFNTLQLSEIVGILFNPFRVKVLIYFNAFQYSAALKGHTYLNKPEVCVSF